MSTIVKWIALKFNADIHDAQRMNPNDCSDPFIFLLAPSGSQSFQLSLKIIPHELD